MNEKRGSRGFTMAELLIVVAIIAVLGAVGFVAVQNYQRGMAQLECDAIAKEIFVAAQNHLTMAESQGYLGLDDMTYGTPGNNSADKDVFNRQQVYYFTVNKGSNSFSGANMLNLMLPFGAIDETVRIGGSYIIRYQPKPARVLDVFYCSTTGSRFSHSLQESDYSALLNIVYDENGHIKENNKDARREYGDSKAVVGWFGDGGEPLLSGDFDIKVPEIEVQNAEKLTVTVTDKNFRKSGAVLKLIVTSKDEHTNSFAGNSGYAKVAFLLDPTSHSSRVSPPDENGNYTVVLDNITAQNEHFADINGITDSTVDKTGTFIPGEDIVVQAVAYSNGKLANIAYSAEITVNSLFADLVDMPDPPDGTTAERQAVIACFRHLENLDESVSGVDHKTLHIIQAKQVADLDWSSLSGEQIYYKATDSYVGSGAGCYKPVNAEYLSLYDGGYTESDKNLSHSITGIKVEYDGNSGLFGTFDFEPEDAAEPAKIANLKLIDFEITSTDGDAGALAGTLNNTAVSNVLAYHNNGSEQTTIIATIGDAGGLVGSMTGGQIEQSAAALYVHAGGNAGGLVGSINNSETATNQTTIIASYSGGHTVDGTAMYDIEHYNVTASNAGGLVGHASNAQINSSYSTCSASGDTAAGGLIGSVDSATGKTVTVNYCYAAGLVKPDAHAGTFLGQGTLKEDCSHYYFVSGINGIMESGCGATPLANVGGDKELLIPAKGESSEDKRAMSEPFDAELMKDDVGIPYTYPTIQQICAVSKPKDAAGKSIVLVSSDFISKHYGDWQEPVTLETGLALINAEKLTAKVSLPVADLGEGQMLTMMVKGKTSDQYAYLVMSLDENTTDSKTTYDVALKDTSKGVDIVGWLEKAIVKLPYIEGGKPFEFGINLDSITDEGCHFAQLFPAFIPGEDITVAIRGNEVTAVEMQAVIDATDEDPLKDKANSLFAETSVQYDIATASIGNFRHLENLDKTISGLGGEESKVTIDTAVQLRDMDWITDWSGGWENATIYLLTDGETPADPLGDTEHFIPVDLNYPLDYQGNSKAISNLVVNHKGHAGLFGSMVAGSSISNLELIDFSVTGTGDAGALAGTLTNTVVSNVLAHHTQDSESTIIATDNAGGLIGRMSDGKVEKCAAAVIVSGGNAGGLIGTTSGETSVIASYSGGHTSNAAYTTAYNVTATGTAGGLIGDAGNATITNSYSTCSAKGTTVGGFVGTAEGTITNCYATGLVVGLTETSVKGAFAVSLSDATNCWFYEIINEGIPALPEGSSIVINAIDYDTASYKGFVGNPDTWNPANPYDPTLGTLFGGSYNLQTVDQLAEGTKTATTVDDIAANFAYTHYGDWPAPELLVVNE